MKTNPELTLYHFPGACSQVTVCAFEQASLQYDLRLVNLFANEQSSPEYLKISPLGKVPVLFIDGIRLTENAAMLMYTATLRPDAGIFPVADTPFKAAEIQSCLSFVGGALHPQVRGIANPGRLTTGDDLDGVRKKSTELLKKSFGYAENRYENSEWWLGEWSVLDVYVNWAFSVARKRGYDISAIPHLSALEERMGSIPAFRRMLEIDAESRVRLGL